MASDCPAIIYILYILNIQQHKMMKLTKPEYCCMNFKENNKNKKATLFIMVDLKLVKHYWTLNNNKWFLPGSL